MEEIIAYKVKGKLVESKKEALIIEAENSLKELMVNMTIHNLLEVLAKDSQCRKDLIATLQTIEANQKQDI